MNEFTQKQVKNIIKENQENLHEKYKDNYLPPSPKNDIDECILNFKSNHDKTTKIYTCGNGSWNTYLIKIKKKIYEVCISGYEGDENIHYIKDLNKDLNVPESPKIVRTIK